ncbi:MAG: PH domain-containing protein [Verrucomicrobiales bacterium]
MPESFYIWEDGERNGPYSAKQIERMLEDQVISFSHECEDATSGRMVMLDELFEPVPENKGDPEMQGTENGEPAMADDPGLPPDALLLRGHPTTLRYRKSLILAMLGIAFGLWLGPTDIWYFIGGFAMSTLTVIGLLIARGTRVYIVTPKRVELIWGVIAKSSNEVRIEDIRIINVRKRGLAGLIGIGTIEFSSAGDSIDVMFTDIWKAQRVKTLVRGLQDKMD